MKDLITPAQRLRGKQKAQMPRWKLFLVFAGIIICFLIAARMETEDLEMRERHWQAREAGR